MVKNPAGNVGNSRDSGWIPRLERYPQGGNEPTPVFLLGKSHGQRILWVTVHDVTNGLWV